MIRVSGLTAIYQSVGRVVVSLSCSSLCVSICVFLSLSLSLQLENDDRYILQTDTQKDRLMLTCSDRQIQTDRQLLTDLLTDINRHTNILTDTQTYLHTYLYTY